MLTQYRSIKQNHRDALLLFRLGDFYELFEQDARIASELLDLTLTHRQGMPMCGVPHHAAQTYIARLLRAGRRVAVCEQVRMPNPGEKIAERRVVEVLSPGTAIAEAYLERGVGNYLFVLAQIGAVIAYCALDVSTGEFRVGRTPSTESSEALREAYRCRPREILTQENPSPEIAAIVRNLSDSDVAVTRLPDWSYSIGTGAQTLREHFGTVSLKGLGLADSDPIAGVAGAALSYAREATQTTLSHITEVRLNGATQEVSIDAATLRNLEVVRNLRDGSERDTLVRAIDATRSPLGARLLRRRLTAPPCSRAAIDGNLARVRIFHRNQRLLDQTRTILPSIHDLERVAARIATSRAGPKELASLRDGIHAARRIDGLIKEAGATDVFPVLEFPVFEELCDLLTRALVEDPPATVDEGKVIRPGYDSDLDDLRDVREHGAQNLAAYLEREREATGVVSLKIKYNRVLGRFFETPRSQAQRLPDRFVPRQMLSNASRFTTEELSRMESAFNDAAEESARRERKVFEALIAAASRHVPEVHGLAEWCAEVDIAQSHARTATVHGYVEPTVVEESVITATALRHPVVEQSLPVGTFVPNPVSLTGNEKAIALVTGPNMVGKSTYLRQTALLALLAHVGSFVPAEEATVGLVDRIYCRVGASDNLAGGESTFLVEMTETAFILRTATPRSLVIMDEVGRGTSSSDGRAIAQAVLECLARSPVPRTLFATHIHELAELTIPHVHNLSLRVLEENGIVTFVREVIQEASPRSYGLHVAALAGVPDAVISRAREILDVVQSAQPEAESLFVSIESAPEETSTPEREDGPPANVQMSLFPPEQMIMADIAGLDPNHLTPMQALERIITWRRELGHGD